MEQEGFYNYTCPECNTEATAEIPYYSRIATRVDYSDSILDRTIRNLYTR